MAHAAAPALPYDLMDRGVAGVTPTPYGSSFEAACVVAGLWHAPPDDGYAAETAAAATAAAEALAPRRKKPHANGLGDPAYRAWFVAHKRLFVRRAQLAALEARVSDAEAAAAADADARDGGPGAPTADAPPAAWWLDQMQCPRKRPAPDDDVAGAAGAPVSDDGDDAASRAAGAAPLLAPLLAPPKREPAERCVTDHWLELTEDAHLGAAGGALSLIHI